MSAVTNRYRGTTDYIPVLAELVHAAEYRGVTSPLAESNSQAPRRHFHCPESCWLRVSSQW